MAVGGPAVRGSLTGMTVSETFDPSAWQEVPGFEQLEDLTYHRAIEHGTVRIAFDRPEVRNAFRPGTVDELLAVLEHSRQSSDVGCVLLTGNGPSPKDGGWAFCSGGDQRIRGKAGYQYADGDTAASVDPAKLGRLHILECQRLIRFMPKIVIAVVPGWAAGGGHSLHVVADLTLADDLVLAEHTAEPVASSSAVDMLLARLQASSSVDDTVVKSSGAAASPSACHIAMRPCMPATEASSSTPVPSIVVDLV